MTNEQKKALKAIREGATKIDAFRASHICDGLSVSEVRRQTRVFFANDEMKGALKRIEKEKKNAQRIQKTATAADRGAPAELLKQTGVFLINTAVEAITARRQALEDSGASPLEVQPYTANDIAAIKVGAALLEPYADADGLAAFIIAQNMQDDE